MSDMDRCCKRMVTNQGKREDWGPCNRFRPAHPGCGHPFDEGIEQVLLFDGEGYEESVFALRAGALETDEMSIQVVGQRDADHPQAYDRIEIDGQLVAWIIRPEHTADLRKALTPAPAEATCDGYNVAKDSVCNLPEKSSIHDKEFEDAGHGRWHRFQPDEGSDA